MEKKYRICKILLIVLLAVLIVGGGIFQIVISRFMDSGVHVLGRFAHLETSQKCFFISQDGQVVGESECVLSGYLYDEPGMEAGSFDGVISIEQYPLPLAWSRFNGSINSDRISIDNRSAEVFYPDADIFYDVSIYRTGEPVIEIIIQYGDGEQLRAICALTEAEALQRLEQIQSMEAKHG